MPSTVNDVFGAAGLHPSGCVPWGVAVPEDQSGVYLVALTDERENVSAALPECPIAIHQVEQLLDVRPELLLDGVRPTPEALAQRYASFWLPDEVVVYVGLTTAPLVNRVDAYYRTSLGRRSPHAGGYWLKVLSALPDLFVHYAACEAVRTAEEALAATFMANVSPATRSRLYDAAVPLPFANRKVPPHGPIKKHGISRDTESLTKPSAPAAVFVGQKPMTVTTKDIERGYLRVTKAFKPLFPVEPGEVDIRLLEQRRRVPWNPNNRERSRSGTLRINDLGDHLTPGDQVVAIQVGGLIEIRRAADISSDRARSTARR